MNEFAVMDDWDLANVYNMMPNCVPNDTSVAQPIKIDTPENESMIPAPSRALYGSLLCGSSMPFDVSCMNLVPTRSACSSEWVIQMMALSVLV